MIHIWRGVYTSYEYYNKETRRIGENHLIV